MLRFAIRCAVVALPAILLLGSLRADDVKVLDSRPRILIQFTDAQRFGMRMTEVKDQKGKGKLLTGDEKGATNNTCIVIDGAQFLFGAEAGGMHWAKDGNGKVQKGVKTGNKWVSRMEHDASKVQVTQTVELVPGEQSRLYDTAFVLYEVSNKDSKAHIVGLRCMLNTHIGARDTVFYVPDVGDVKGFTVDGLKTVAKKDIPESIRVSEDKGKEPGVAELGLKITGLEALDKLVMCRWPGNAEARWDWKYESLAQQKIKDPCTVLYWDKASMNAGTQRELGFTYGLGRITKKPGK